MDQGDSTDGKTYHEPALAEEVVDLMRPVLPGLVIDATFGGGGHTRRLLDEFGSDTRVVAVDRDPDALRLARGIGVTAIEGNFADLTALIAPHVEQDVDAVLFDFGVSSHQLDEASRGFSYHAEGPLDMRMGPDAPLTAHEIVNAWPEEELALLIRRNGEDPNASRIARAIVSARPIESTSQLSTVIAAATPAARRRAGHPARRTFQALRIAVNDELGSIERGLQQAIDVVRLGGRIVAISYHSLEDRIVKRRFARGAKGCVCPPDLPVCGCGQTAELRLLTRKPIRPGAEEIERNRRARSAVLRAAEKTAA